MPYVLENSVTRENLIKKLQQFLQGLFIIAKILQRLVLQLLCQEKGLFKNVRILLVFKLVFCQKHNVQNNKNLLIRYFSFAKKNNYLKLESQTLKKKKNLHTILLQTTCSTEQ